MLKKISLAEQAYDELVKNIITGVHSGGEMLQEERLAADFGISRTPVREALQRLAAEGLVEQLPRRGFRVALPEEEALSELFECRCVLETSALQKSIHHIPAEEIEPTVTWGISPDMNIGVNGVVPAPEQARDAEGRKAYTTALEYMKLAPGQPIKGLPVDVVFIGSCTNGHITDFREVAPYLKGRKVKPGIKALAVPGSQMTALQCEQEGIAQIFREAGFEWRLPGCSMCLAMNPDKLVGDQICASTSNRNFKGRQGSPTGRTLLMSPIMAAAAAITGTVADAREVFDIQ